MPSDSLFLTEAEVAKKIGLKTEQWPETAKTLEKQGFPRPDPLFENRRYWPACKAFLDGRYHLSQSSTPGIVPVDGEERW